MTYINQRIIQYTLVAALLLFHVPAMADIEYRPGILAKVPEDKVLLLDYQTAWCGVCTVQKRLMRQLRKQNPQYNQKIVFMTVNWDTYANHGIVKTHRIPFQGTLLLLRNNKEIGRLVGLTGKEEVQALLDRAL